MKILDYCRVMEKIGARPHDKVDMTVGQLLQLKAHLKGCHKCAAICEAINRMNPEPPRIGPKPGAN